MNAYPHSHIRWFGGKQFRLTDDATVRRVSHDLEQQRVTVEVDYEREVPCVLGLIVLRTD